MGPPPVGTLRPVRDTDADGLIALIGSVFAEYPGCVLDLAGLDADLTAWASSLRARGGRGWVVVDDADAVIAAVGAVPTTVDGRPGVELKRLYVVRSQRRQGLGRYLIGVVRAEAVRLGAERIELWSDTRFTDAHRLYLAAGFAQRPETRHLDDPSDTTEHHFVAPLP